MTLILLVTLPLIENKQTQYKECEIIKKRFIKSEWHNKLMQLLKYSIVQIFNSYSDL